MSRIGVLLSEDLTEKLEYICSYLEEEPFDVVKLAIDTLHQAIDKRDKN